MAGNLSTPSLGAGSLGIGSLVPERMSAIEARFGLPDSSSSGPTDDFDAVLDRMRQNASGDSSTRVPVAGPLITGPLPAWLLAATGQTPAGLRSTSSGASAASGLAPDGPAGPVAVQGTDTGSGAGDGADGTNGAAVGAAMGQAVVDAALQYLGVPYLWGGSDPAKGLDCSGLVQDAFAQLGVAMPRWSRTQATMGTEVPSLDQAQPGDLVAFGHPVSHVGIYVGDGKMINAPRKGETVRVETIDRPVATIRRIIGPPAAAPAAPASSGPTSSADAGGTDPTGDAGYDERAWTALSPAEERYQSLFQSAGQRWNVDPALLAAMAQTESGFNPKAVSPVGAQGLMQFMPSTAASMGVNPWDPASAIDGAARYLRASLDQFGSVEAAIASYNAGRGAVQRYGGVPPFRETQAYVQKVQASWRARS